MKAFFRRKVMKSERNAYGPQMMPFQGANQMPGIMPGAMPGNMPGNIPTNMMMFPNYMNDNYSSLDNRMGSLEKKIKVLENRISRLETPYQGSNNTQNFQTPQTQSQTQPPYQATQNNGNYSGEMYMM